MKRYILYTLIAIAFIACSKDETTPMTPSSTRSSFLDERDGYEYKTIKIGNQEWMAENLRYRFPKGPIDGSWTYKERRPSEDIDTAQILVNTKTTFIADFPDAANPRTDIGQCMSFADQYVKGAMPWATVAQYVGFYVMMGMVDEVIGNKFLEDFPKYEKAEFDKFISKMYIVYTDFDYAERYGYLYTYEGAVNAVPEGWSLPSDEDWKELEQTLGISENELNKLEAWRGTVQGTFLKEQNGELGFNALLGGAHFYGNFGDGVTQGEDTGYRGIELKTEFWTSTSFAQSDSTTWAYTRKLEYSDSRIYRGTATTEDTRYSVRCIKKKNDNN